jgi:hypothetical protein
VQNGYEARDPDDVEWLDEFGGRWSPPMRDPVHDGNGAYPPRRMRRSDDAARWSGGDAGIGWARYPADEPIDDDETGRVGRRSEPSGDQWSAGSGWTSARWEQRDDPLEPAPGRRQSADVDELGTQPFVPVDVESPPPAARRPPPRPAEARARGRSVDDHPRYPVDEPEHAAEPDAVRRRPAPAGERPVAWSDPMRSEPARSDPARSEPARSDPARSEAARPEPARPRRRDPAVGDAPRRQPPDRQRDRAPQGSGGAVRPWRKAAERLAPLVVRLRSSAEWLVGTIRRSVPLRTVLLLLPPLVLPGLAFDLSVGAVLVVALLLVWVAAAAGLFAAMTLDGRQQLTLRSIERRLEQLRGDKPASDGDALLAVGERLDALGDRIDALTDAAGTPVGARPAAVRPQQQDRRREPTGERDEAYPSAAAGFSDSAATGSVADRRTRQWGQPPWPR